MVRYFLIGFFVFQIQFVSPASEPADNKLSDAEQIKGLIPAAAAMSKDDFKGIVEGENASSIKGTVSKSLTFHLFTLEIKPGVTKEQYEELEITGRTPSPAKLVREISRIQEPGQPIPGLVTMIHSDRITDFSCEVDSKNGRAKGTVSFEAPGIFRGKANYAARRSGSKWSVSEFHMPNRQIHIRLGSDKLWHRIPTE